MRLQLAINVSDLDSSVEFYRRLFSTEPAKVKPGYANFAISDPPLKLVLFENADDPGSINHLGVETETGAEVTAAEERLRTEGLATTGVDETRCCYAEKTETWITAPDDLRWEYYVKKGDIDQPGYELVGAEASDAACGGSTPGICCS